MKFDCSSIDILLGTTSITHKLPILTLSTTNTVPKRRFKDLKNMKEIRMKFVHTRERKKSVD